MRNFQDTFKTRKQSFTSVFSICMTVPLNSDNLLTGQQKIELCCIKSSFQIYQVSLLKELQNSVFRTILAWSLLYSIRVYISLYFLPFLLEN